MFVPTAVSNKLCDNVGASPPSFARLELRNAVRTTVQAHWASLAGCLPMVKERHPEVVASDVAGLQKQTPRSDRDNQRQTETHRQRERDRDRQREIAETLKKFSLHCGVAARNPMVSHRRPAMERHAQRSRTEARPHRI